MKKTGTQSERQLLSLLQQVASGQISANNAAVQIEAGQVCVIDGATIDMGRKTRCGMPEAIYGEGKSASLIIEIAQVLLRETEHEVLVTRVCDTFAESIAKPFAFHRHNTIARTLRLSDKPVVAAEAIAKYGPVAVITAGSTDRPVAMEAAETLAWMGVQSIWLEDIGVAGPQRLLRSLDLLRSCCAAVVAAGMEGALPSVVAGHVSFPVIGVPTSVGYGAALGGFSALLSMLNSCAANVAVVNIDAGFKAGYLAGMIARGFTEKAALPN